MKKVMILFVLFCSNLAFSQESLKKSGEECQTWSECASGSCQGETFPFHCTLEEGEEQLQLTPEQAKEKAKTEKEERREQFNKKFYSNKGNIEKLFEKWLKEVANDPDSVKDVKCELSSVFCFVCSYRAKNGFGAYMIGEEETCFSESEGVENIMNF